MRTLKKYILSAARNAGYFLFELLMLGLDRRRQYYAIRLQQDPRRKYR